MLERHLAVARQLEAWIAAQGLQPGARLPSARQWAMRLDLPRSTVNQAVAGLLSQGRLRHDGRRLLLAAPARHAGMPPLWVVSALPAVQRGVRELAAETGWDCPVLVERDWSRLSGRVLRLVEAGASGLLLWPPPPAAELRALLLQRQVPCVMGGDAVAGFHSVAPAFSQCSGLAVTHLAALGHRHLALCGLADVGAPPSLWAGYRAACAAHGVRGGSRRLEATDMTAAALHQLVLRLIHCRPRPTAVVCETGDLAIGLLAALHKHGVRVPEACSLVSCAYSLRPSTPAITLATVSDHEMARLALTMLAKRVADRQRGLPPSPPVCVELAPWLRVQGSSAPPPGVAPPAELARPVANDPPAAQKKVYVSLGSRALAWSVADRQQWAAATWTTAYRIAGGAPPGAFAPLDFSAACNRFLGRNHGWLGAEPLAHVLPGPLNAHGVPFHLAGGPGAGQARGLVLRAAGSKRGRQPLPDVAILPVGRRVRAVYFLHGCGYAAEHAQAGAYDFRLADGSTATVPLIPWGRDVPDAADRDRRDCQATIQDWYPSFPQFNNTQSRHLVVTEDGDPTLYERYLYTLEWINPRPTVPVESIHVRVFGPQAMTLGVLAITLLV